MIAAGNLRERLGRIAGTTPAIRADEPVATAGADLACLLQRVESMRLRSRSHARPPQAVPDVAAMLGARTVDPGLLLVERRHPLWQPFGRRTLGHWLGLAQPMVATALGTSFDRLLFIDTETSGLAGGTGTIAWMAGIARIEAGAIMTRQYVLTRFGAERAMLEALRGEVGPDTTLVSFNGRSFDLPLLATRLRLNRLDPLPPAYHLDLLHPLRRRFRAGLPDCRLQTLEAHILGKPREDDLAGSAAPALWNALLAGSADAGLEGMARHNRIDLLAMVALLHAVDKV